MWGEVDLKKGEKREAQLRDKFFKPAIDKGTKFLRHDNTEKTAHYILRNIIPNDPLPLRIQIELVDEKKNLLETVAGEELNREILELTRKQDTEIRRLQEEIAGNALSDKIFLLLTIGNAEAMRMKDEQTRLELEDARRELQGKVDSLKYDAENLEMAHHKQKVIQKLGVKSLLRDASTDHVQRGLDGMSHDLENHKQKVTQKQRVGRLVGDIPHDEQIKFSKEHEQQISQVSRTAKRTMKPQSFADASQIAPKSLLRHEQVNKQEAWVQHTERYGPAQQQDTPYINDLQMDRFKATLENRLAALERRIQKLEQELCMLQEKYDREIKRAQAYYSCTLQWWIVILIEFIISLYSSLYYYYALFVVLPTQAYLHDDTYHEHTQTI